MLSIKYLVVEAQSLPLNLGGQPEHLEEKGIFSKVHE
jgi:hypothetical protein